MLTATYCLVESSHRTVLIPHRPGNSLENNSDSVSSQRAGSEFWLSTHNTVHHDALCFTVHSHQSCPTLCDPMDCSPPGSPVHGILQERTLEWVSILSSMGSSQSRDQTQVSSTAGRFFTIWATREARHHILQLFNPQQKARLHTGQWPNINIKLSEKSLEGIALLFLVSPSFRQ